MNKNNIEQLLQKYWDAESSIEEENVLSNYFSGDNIAPEHEQFASMFTFFTTEKNVVADNIDLSKIDFDADERKNKYGHFRLSPMKMGIAASFILLLSFIGGLRLSDQEKYTDSYASNMVVYDEDAEMQEAYEMTKKALSILSSSLKSGQKKVSENLDEIDKVNILN